MSQYIYVPEQEVLLNQAAIFDSAVPCSNGAIDHSNGSGVFALQGITLFPYQRGTWYNVIFNGNIAVPTGGTVGPIAVGLALNGEVLPASVAITTPTAVNQFNNVSCTASFFVRRGYTFTLSLHAVAPPTDLAPTPAPSVLLRNANIRFNGQIV